MSSTNESGAWKPPVIMVSPIPPIEKLRGTEDYHNWKFLMKLLLTSEGLHKLVQAEPSADLLADENSDVSQRDLRARTMIALLIDCPLIKHIRGAKTAFQMWSCLSRAFELSFFRLFEKLHECKQGKMPMAAYVVEFRDLLVRLAEAKAGKPLDEMAAAVLLMTNVRPELAHLQWILYDSSVIKKLDDGRETVDFEAVVQMLLRNEDVIRLECSEA